MTPEQRFWKHVDRRGADECWPWTGAKGVYGHGHFSVKQKTISAARFSYELHKGRLGRLFACHNCPGGDNPSCVNPAHLWAGTAGDNNVDSRRKAKQRWLQEELLPTYDDRSRLTQRLIVHQGEKSGRAFARQLGITHVRWGQIKRGEPPGLQFLRHVLALYPDMRNDVVAYLVSELALERRAESGLDGRLSLPAHASILGDTANLEEAPA